jgi:uncharacterized membrane protein YccC
LTGTAGGRIRSALAAFVRPNASPPRLGVALQSGLAMLLAVGIPALFGRTDLGLLASSGALTALYLVTRSRRERLRRLPVIQLGLLASAAIAAIPAGHPVLAPVVLAAVVIAAAVLLLGVSVGPPGVLFFVLVPGVTARLTAPVDRGGDALDLRLVLGMQALGCLLALAIAVLPLAVPAVRAADRTVPVAPLRFDLTPETRVVVLRLAIAVVVATAVSAPLGLHRTYWVLLAVVAALQAGPSRRLTALRAVHRVAGTALGLVLFAGLALLRPEGLLLAALVAALQFATELVVIRHYGLALVLITPLALSIAEAGSRQAIGTVVVERIIDTAVGAGIALAVLAADLVVERARRSAPPRIAP